mmetsp:Transcript_30758/g.73752  ORF Transcript_30758/g.73752 Transcript_30758/m.73752 type:complete len:114 (+) Transcript_30758:1074-1415(+)
MRAEVTAAAATAANSVALTVKWTTPPCVLRARLLMRRGFVATQTTDSTFGAVSATNACQIGWTTIYLEGHRSACYAVAGFVPLTDRTAQLFPYRERMLVGLETRFCGGFQAQH